jgi:hypothetical protein
VALDIGVHLELDVPKGTGWREGERWSAEIGWETLRAHSSWDERMLPRLRTLSKTPTGPGGRGSGRAVADQPDDRGDEQR